MADPQVNWSGHSVWYVVRGVLTQTRFLTWSACWGVKHLRIGDETELGDTYEDLVRINILLRDIARSFAWEIKLFTNHFALFDAEFPDSITSLGEPHGRDQLHHLRQPYHQLSRWRLLIIKEMRSWQYLIFGTQVESSQSSEALSV